jgi:carboxylesterase type B
MVWIVGGGWTTGTTNNVYGNDGEHIVDEEDVIVVSMKYVSKCPSVRCWC